MVPFLSSGRLLAHCFASMEHARASLATASRTVIVLSDFEFGDHKRFLRLVDVIRLRLFAQKV
jgi:hypothetical protein